jgi:hypothetical protein
VFNKPVEKLFVSYVHAQGYLGLTSIAAEVTFAHKNAQEKAFFEVIHVLVILEICCFTVKFHVKRGAVLFSPAGRLFAAPSRRTCCFTVKFHVKQEGDILVRATIHNQHAVVYSDEQEVSRVIL